MKYTSQHCCDKTLDGKMAIYRECDFLIVQNHGEKSNFVGFKEDDCPLDLPMPFSSTDVRYKHLWMFIVGKLWLFLRPLPWCKHMSFFIEWWWGECFVCKIRVLA